MDLNGYDGKSHMTPYEYRITSSLKIKTDIIVSTVNPAHVVTSIKQFPVLKGHLFLVLSYESNLF